MGKKKGEPQAEVKAGPGKKKCVCGAIIGARTMKCPHCAHEFTPKAKAPKAVFGSGASPSSFRDALEAEKRRLEDALANREILEARLEAINAVLQTFDD
jgi:hypothetical protein